MRRIQLSGTSVALDANGFGNDVTGATFTLTANDSGDSLAHIVTILNNTANSHAAKTITLVGTDENGNPLTETVTGPGASVSVSSTKHFLTLTSATPSATIGADTFDIGWSAASVSPHYVPPNANLPAFSIGYSCVISGTPTYTVEQTYDGETWFSDTHATNRTISIDNEITRPIAALRLSWSVAGGVTFTGFQVGV